MGEKSAYFRASNGMQVRLCENGGVEAGRPGFLDYVLPAATFALEEFFRAKRDEELGRWRWKENPEFVVYPFSNGEGCTAHSERTGVSKTFISRDAAVEDGTYLAEAARAFFEAHPERVREDGVYVSVEFAHRAWVARIWKSVRGEWRDEHGLRIPDHVTPDALGVQVIRLVPQPEVAA